MKLQLHDTLIAEWNEKLGKPECPYLHRWSVHFGRLGSIRLHHWVRSDDKRYHHDHPSDFITVVLAGSYTDLCDGPGRYAGLEPHRCGTCQGTRGVICDLCGNGMRNERMTPGRIRRRAAEHQHIVAVDEGGCWTLLYFFPKRRPWGYWVPRKDTGKLRFRKANKYFIENGHHPCDQP